MKPLIGVCASHDIGNRQFFVRENYMESLIRAGGIPVLLPMNTDAEVCRQMMERMDALFLAGGGDVDPAYYHMEKIPECGEIDPLRDAFEFLVLKEALDRNPPVFGVCRGIQVMNVFFGGTLIQDIPTQAGGLEVHQQGDHYDLPIHSIDLCPDGLLAKIIPEKKIAVNSSHHQSILKVADALSVDAFSEEGIIEAVHLKNSEKVYGVQFHPEHFTYKSKIAQSLFDYFVSCA